MHLEAQVVTEPAKVDARAVYDFASQMNNLPRWASGLASGVMDHDVTLPDGTSVHNAFRVTPAGDSSVLTFVVLRMPGTSQEAFEADVAHVRKDLKALRRLLETGQAPA